MCKAFIWKEASSSRITLISCDFPKDTEVTGDVTNQQSQSLKVEAFRSPHGLTLIYKFQRLLHICFFLCRQPARCLRA